MEHIQTQTRRFTTKIFWKICKRNIIKVICFNSHTYCECCSTASILTEFLPVVTSPFLSQNERPGSIMVNTPTPSPFLIQLTPFVFQQISAVFFSHCSIFSFRWDVCCRKYYLFIQTISSALPCTGRFSRESVLFSFTTTLSHNAQRHSSFSDMCTSFTSLPFSRHSTFSSNLFAEKSNVYL